MTSEGQVVLPSQFGRYTLLQRLAAGGMAEVFRAKIVSSHGFEKIIVIKRILPHLAADRTFVAMFIDEAKLTAQLTHPKIVQVLDFGEVAGQYFIALEFIDGYDALALLRAAAQKRIRVPLSLVVFIVAEILDALDYAHTASDMEGRPMRLVHRDISPSNIFISRHGDVKLGDFGIAHSSDRESQTQAGTLKGKYGYMSPEQVTGAGIDNRSDLFAVGIVLAEAFMGRRLFTARNELDVLLMVRDGRLDRLYRYGHDIPPELDQIVRRALTRDIERRYQTASEFRDALFDYLFAQRIRVGPADLRAFISDLFDASPEATTRIQKQGRRLSEPLSQGSVPVVATAAGQSPTARVVVDLASDPMERRRGATPPAPGEISPTQQPAKITPGGPGGGGRPGPGVANSVPAGPTGATAVSRGVHLDDGTPDPKPASAVASPGSPLAEALSANEFALIDLDQWDMSAQNSSAPGTGWTPISAAPARTPAPPPIRPGANTTGVAPVGRGVADAKNDLGRFTSAAPNRPPDSAGELGTISAMRIFADVTVAGETGLLRFERSPAGSDPQSAVPISPDTEVKEVFLAAGSPESVNSSVASERFGAYLVSRGVLRVAELEMALGMLPHFSGKLGDTLVGLGLMRPLDVFRQLSQQVRDRVIDLFRWSDGTFAFFRGVRNVQESFPLGLDGFEILGAGVLTVPAAELERRFSSLLDSRPRRTERRQINPDAFDLGPTPREVLALLDGERTLQSWIAQFTSLDERATFLRSLYLLIETDLAELD
jgi:serine/threonine protein kinase